MAWGSRQKRLRDMVGPNTNLCFQVFVCAITTRRFETESEFNKVAQQLGVDMAGKDHFTLPKKNYMEELISPGYLLNRPGFWQARRLATEALYTQAPYSLSKSSPHHSDDLDAVMARYVPAIEATFPALRFGEEKYADSKNLDVEFRFIVQPYAPDICHPRDIGVLKPITIMGRDALHPV